MVLDISKVDPRLAWVLLASPEERKRRHLIDKAAAAYRAAPFLYGVRLLDDGHFVASVLVRFNDRDWFDSNRDVLERMGVKIRSVSYDGSSPTPSSSHVATAEVPEETINQWLEANGPVRYIELARVGYPQLDRSVRALGVDAPYRAFHPGLGAGAVVGIIDIYRIAFYHSTFRKLGANGVPGDTRIRYIWDQLASPGPNGEGKVKYGYGREYEKTEINQDLQSGKPYSVIDYRPEQISEATSEGNHGTHVAAIAAGNGNPAQPGEEALYVGVAPAAHIIYVNVPAFPPAGKGLADLCGMCDAIDYIFKKADDLQLPCVISISLGDDLGPHDGTTNVEHYIDNAVHDKEGRAVVIAAGNDNNHGHHIEGSVSSGKSATIQFAVENKVGLVLPIRIYYPQGFEFSLTVYPPDEEEAVGPIGVTGSKAEIILGSGGTIGVISKTGDEKHPDNVIELSLAPSLGGVVRSGTWTLEIHEESGSSKTARYDAWLWESKAMYWIKPSPSKACTLSSLATCKRAITVGFYNDYQEPPYSVDSSSGRGPTRDLRQKPDLVAPGISIKSASWLLDGTNPDGTDRRYGNEHWVDMYGSSAAAPHVAGLVALMLDGEPLLTFQQIKDKLQLAADPDGFGSSECSLNRGWGRARIAKP